jgi:hypothetical protein
MHYVTVIATRKLVVQDTGPDEHGMVTIRYQIDGHTEQVHESKVTRLRKYMHGRIVDVHFCGYATCEHTSWSATPKEKGVTWTCYCSNHNELSAWVRLEAPGYRARFVYDPGNHWRKTLDGRIN